ncbi:MAG: sulfotransferase family protein [Actinomycetota bacterium]|nr:sulfotransferase family protein [Actinomycetota bacterium]
MSQPSTPRAYLHIGAPKTGTTYLQAVLSANRDALATAGVLYPGRLDAAHFLAAQDLRGLTFAGHTDARVPGAWDRTADRVRRWRGPSAIVSHELLAGCDREAITTAVESLSPREVHVVFTARDLARQIPAMWQESVKNGRTAALDAYTRRLTRDGTGRVGAMLEQSLDAARVLSRWSDVVTPERIHVVTVSGTPAPPAQLWTRFCRAAGLDPACCDTDVEQRNASMGLAETELVRQLNQRLGDRFDWPTYERLVKQWLAKQVLAARRPSAPSQLPADLRPWVDARSAEITATLSAAGYDVVGSLDDLMPSWDDHQDRRTSATPPPGDALDASLDAMVALLDEVARLQARADRSPVRQLRRVVRARLTR